MIKPLATGIAAAAAAALLCAGQANAQVDVFGGGLAEACAKAAKSGETTPAAEQVCTQALDREMLIPLDRAGTYVNRGILKLRGRRYDEAIRDFDTAIRYQASLAEAYVNRAAARIGIRQYGQSVSDIDNALMLDVKEPEKAYYNRAVAHEYLDDYKDAWLDYRKALEIAPTWDLPRQQLVRFSVSHPIEALPVVDLPPAPVKP
jgi:tetratricopeptide (TPR) repeat protein